MKFHVVYESGKIDYFGSNVDLWDFTCYKPSWLLSHPNIQVVTWQLNDLPLTLKWIETYKNKFNAIVSSRKTKNPFKYKTVYDVYGHPTKERVLESYQVMNQKIDYINNHEVTKNRISEDLKLNETNLDIVEIDKLNRLHEDFETIMNDLTERRSKKLISIDENDWSNIWLALQSINLIVHYNEKFSPTSKISDYLEKVEPFHFTALKWEEPPGTTVLLEDSDYKYFTLEETVDTLWLDFGTVGKDLFHCFCTNDVELIQNNMVSPQWELKPWVSYQWTERSKSDAEIFKNQYVQWLNDNEAKKYLDITHPKYSPGRHPLGKCISHTFRDPADFINQIINKTPKIRCYILTDDYGNSIL